MRVLVCGGRNYSDADTMARVLDEHHKALPFSAVIYGMARGADTLAKEWAISRGIRRFGFPANWERYGRRSGPIRNQRMIDVGSPDLVIAFPGGSGTADMITRAKKAGVKVVEVKG